MIFVKAQKVIFNELAKPHSYIRKFDVDEHHVFVTPDGYYGFVLPKRDMVINLDCIPSVSNPLDLAGIAVPENLCKLTNKLVIHKQLGNLRILMKGDTAIYLQSKFLKCFDDGEFYQATPFGRVVIKYGEDIIGAICPVRYEERGE